MTSAGSAPAQQPQQKIAVVTGASSGIGAAIARRLAERGWRCVLVARREDRLRALAEEIGGEAELCDVADRDAVEALAARILVRHPAVHLLVNNAGIPARGDFLVVDLDRIQRVMEVNYLGGVWCTRALMPGLRVAAGQGGAHIVNLVSVAGTAAFAPAGAYAASKHAQLAFSRSLAAALRGSGIRVHSVLPGFVETEGFPQKGVLKSPLLGKFVIQPPRVANAVVDAVEKDKAEVTVPWFPYRLVSIAQALMPRVVGRFSGMSDYRPGSIPLSTEPEPEDNARSLSRPTHSAKSGSTSE
ncbi:MAG TPA: SDR family NAD(P)-dependent oxidoreductase [Gaiella sp.]|nr:SDR family NAD(P)-dependent oxidoreductase [Gaiella sp.]